MRISAAMPAIETATHDHADARHRLNIQALAWKKRSRKISRLRLIFPGLIIGTVLLMIVWIVVQSVINSMNVYTTTGEDIRMTNPFYTDRSRNGERYEMRGLEAVRKGRTSQIVTLTAPRMEIRSENSRPSALEGAVGVYDDTKRRFTLNKDVTLNSGNGLSLRTQAADVDLQSAVITGNTPVEGRWQTGVVNAQAFRVEQNGRKVVFYGKPGQQVTGTLSGDEN
ncbi:LPS export ABC transporter periplasmic protein LptC [Asticcacaulis sp. W401b]|uniref:LPS export ABC transporter periplasmic protein LptC n=1 Tax=Asticcacaulis sp. W401b TaxID=3388666 RepID=UPI003970A0AA